MGRASDSRTSASLIGRLQNDRTDQQAWEEFVERYGPKVHAWCRRWTANTADVEDVSQAVMLRLLQYLRDWRYNPEQSFRAWLRTITRNAWHDFSRTRARAVPGSGDSAIQDRLESVEAREELVKKLDEAFDLELLEEASARVRLRVKPATWEAFRLMHSEGLSGAAVAERLGMKVATVFVACSKVQKMLHEELQRLEHAAQDGKALS
jgi:RNA polymerase sigma-70 factor (ECF subfamily)